MALTDTGSKSITSMAFTAVVESDCLVIDKTLFGQIAQLLPATEVEDNLRTLIGRCEALLDGLRTSDMLSRASHLSDAAHQLAGGAGTLGFLFVASAAQMFEAAADMNSPELLTLADRLIAAIEVSMPVIQREFAAIVSAAP